MNNDTIMIELTKGYTTVIDAVDADLAERKWHTRDVGVNVYAVRRNRIGNGKRRTEHLHRVVLSRVLGRELESEEFVDHINGDSLDNRRCNLRFATKQQNNRNQRRPVNNRSGYKGAAYHKASGLYHSTIRVNGKQLSLGYYRTPQEAHEAYKKAAVKYYGDFARFE